MVRLQVYILVYTFTDMNEEALKAWMEKDDEEELSKPHTQLGHSH